MALADKREKLPQEDRACTVSEEPYSTKTLQGNWFEERSDIKAVQEPKPLPSQHAHYYETTYAASYNREETPKTTFEREPHIYPGHQPELDPPQTKFIPKTCYMIDYVAPSQKRRALLAAMKGQAEDTEQPGEQKVSKSAQMAIIRRSEWGPATSKNIPQTSYMRDFMAPSERRKALHAFLEKTEGGAKDPPAEDKVSTAPSVAARDFKALRAPPVFKREPPAFSTYRPEPGPPKAAFVNKSCYMIDYVAPNLRP
ncbi:UPF0686 protein C11orf1 homolog [Rhinatrema bivittatum]|uniref:UPF0686 protein C11orf1 homolog n=1 Tax=Rhinatrema bivittatum TaxID=194408 RepID=UPI001129886F|nr:UPF0686 protein C11orf1 homolog [Rhinatrema bivittatum]XP_029429328.1 UPF0686 protein C11orf1 homolog [Rhinatrema bivittatum]XP_029429329.1 UPF0686 protein C11orf1 homolog [Rhinatrema bivittatum]